jgi:hypothetical protein
MTHDQIRARMQDAHSRGKNRGYEAVEHCEVGEGETLREAAIRAESNARQYASHIPQWVRDDRGFYRAYEDGVKTAILDAT